MIAAEDPTIHGWKEPLFQIRLESNFIGGLGDAVSCLLREITLGKMFEFIRARRVGEVTKQPRNIMIGTAGGELREKRFQMFLREGPRERGLFARKGDARNKAGGPAGREFIG